VGRSLPELTQAIISGTVQPPSIHKPDLSPDLEQIILVAMARNRDDRYKRATLMAQALRALNLKALADAAPGVKPAFSIHANGHRPSQEKSFIQPPKRPRPPMQQYRSVDLEITQIPPGEAITPPLLTQPPSAFKPEISRTREQKIDIEGPTGPLNHDQQPPPGYKLLSQSKLTKRQRFWRKLFRSSRLGQ
jgi:serine/threonine-protein kinase